MVPGSFTPQEALNQIDQKVKHSFDSNRRILTFEEYLAIFAEKPHLHSRGSARYVTDMMDFYGKTEMKNPIYDSASNRSIYRFHLFDRPIENIAPKVVGHESVQTEIYQTFQSFARQGMNNRLVLLHGPNGSAKSTISHALMGGLESYSKEPEGAAYTFNWVFPVERNLKSSMGISKNYEESRDHYLSFAKLDEDDIAARIPSELKDHPLLLVPKEMRKAVIENLLGNRAAKIWERMPVYLREGDLSHRSKEISEALLNAYKGDFKKVMRHVQVERFYFSRRYRKGLVTIEPQMHVDAHYEQLTMNKSISSLPASLQGLNLFNLRGDLIDANRGIVEFSDLLKRPVDTFKYLLVSCETGSVNVQSSLAYFDSIMIGSSNEIQLDAFKDFPDFGSFKARIELIRVPYLLSVSQEREIYSLLTPQISGDKAVAPHVDWAMALWAVLTRLKKPNSINYPPSLSSIISGLTPFDKSRIYDSGELPNSLSPEDRKILKSHLRKLRDEYRNIPYYEGRVGASVREIKTILFEAVHDSEFPCLSPLAVFKQIEFFIKKVSEYDFLKQEVKDGYHDAAEFLNTVRNEYLNVIDDEVRECMGLYDTRQWEDFIQKYVQHVSQVIKAEKIRNPVTGRSEDPDLSLIQEFEKIVKAPKAEKELHRFRQSVISQIGAWALDHPNEDVIYSKVFPEYWDRLEKHYFEGQKGLLTKMHNVLQLGDTGQADPHSEGEQLARLTIKNMVEKRGYTEESAKEVITYLMKKRY